MPGWRLSDKYGNTFFSISPADSRCARTHTKINVFSQFLTKRTYFTMPAFDMRQGLRKRYRKRMCNK